MSDFSYAVEVLDRRPDGEDHEIVTLRLPVRHTDLSGIPQPEVVRHDSSLFAFVGPEPLPLDVEVERIAREFERRMAFVGVTELDAFRGLLEAGVILPGPAVTGEIEEVE